MTSLLRSISCGSLLLAITACSKPAPPKPDPSPGEGPTAAVAPEPAPPAPVEPSASASASASAVVAADTGAPMVAAKDGGAAGAVADNNVAPSDGPELQQRARGLFEAIVKDAPERGEAFWFPEEPFIPLKDVRDPAKYWEQLHHTYTNDIHLLHEKRKSWDGAEFVKFEGGARETWVPPGKEANKIGYHRAFHGKLRYRIGGEDAAIDVQTFITWQGRWYVTHLRKFRS